jgi:hypothetical protein
MIFNVTGILALYNRCDCLSLRPIRLTQAIAAEVPDLLLNPKPTAGKFMKGKT